MPPVFADPRIPYHADGTRVFHRLTSNDPRSARFYNATSFTEFTDDQREYLNGDRRHAVSFYSTVRDDTNSFNIDLYARDVTFFFPTHMSLTAIFLGSQDTTSSNGFEHGYQHIEALVSPDTTALDDGTWVSLGLVPLSTKHVTDSAITTDETNLLRFVRLNEDPIDTSRTVRFDPPGFRVAWDADLFEWRQPRIAHTEPQTRMDHGLGIIPLYGEGWSNVLALRLQVSGNFNALGDSVAIHLYGRPMDPNVAGLSYERADGEPLVARDLSWGDSFPQSGVHVLGPFRLRNTTDQTAEGVTARVAGTLDWGYTEATDPAYADEFYSPIMPFVTARIAGGPWQASAISGKHIALVVGDLAPGETSDEIEVRFDYTSPQVDDWTRARLLMTAEVGVWT